ncbi:MAG: class I SAM-dependent methyltransferase [Pseudomonadota bacterium]
MRIYRDLVDWYPLISIVEEYAEEADHLVKVVEATAGGAASSLLELGAGAGHLASHLKGRFACTLTDLSPEMLDLSRDLNPECMHVQGDMRSLRLGRTFDVVLIHDAIGYMITRDDLAAAIETARAHLAPGGVAIFIPDLIRDRFQPAVGSGGADLPDGRGLRYLEWVHDPDPGDTVVDVDFCLMIREPGRDVRVEHDKHVEGLFDRATWRSLMIEAGLQPVPVDVPDPHAGEHEVFVARHRAARPPLA